eukprot:1156585-Pelagomonas_calceolata.AAC.1
MEAGRSWVHAAQAGGWEWQKLTSGGGWKLAGTLPELRTPEQMMTWLWFALRIAQQRCMLNAGDACAADGLSSIQ